MLDFLNFPFSSPSRRTCSIMPNFVVFGQFSAEIWSYNDFKMAAVAMLDFRNLTFSSANHCTRVILPSHSKFRLQRTLRSRVIAKKWFSIWHPSTILILGISEFFSHFRRGGQNLRPGTKFHHIRAIRGWSQCSTVVRTVVRATQQVKGTWQFWGVRTP